MMSPLRLTEMGPQSDCRDIPAVSVRMQRGRVWGYRFNLELEVEKAEGNSSVRIIFLFEKKNIKLIDFSF